MNSETVSVNNPGMTAYGRKIKAAFTLFDEVFHFSAATVILEDLVGFHFQCCYDKGIKMCQLIRWLFNLKNHASRMRPAPRLILEFAIFYGVIHGVVSGCTRKRIIRIGSEFPKFCVFL